jgi:hypothetical protein
VLDLVEIGAFLEDRYSFDSSSLGRQVMDLGCYERLVCFGILILLTSDRDFA